MEVFAPKAMNIHKVTEAFHWANLRQRRYQAKGIQADAILALWPMIEEAHIETALEVGAGQLPSAMSTLLAQHGITALHTDLLASAAVTTLADAHDLPFPDDTYDMVIARHVLEHCLIPYLAVTEMARVSRKWVLVVVPEDTAWFYDSPGHLHGYNGIGWSTLWQVVGLKEHRISAFDITEEPERPQWEWRWLLHKPSGWKPWNTGRET